MVALMAQSEIKIFSAVSNIDLQLTPWSKVLLQKLIVAQLAEKFPAFHGTSVFITVFTRTPYWILS
jgi:hypothetical protein